jgi:hypothetical protein
LKFGGSNCVYKSPIDKGFIEYASINVLEDGFTFVVMREVEALVGGNLRAIEWENSWP